MWYTTEDEAKAACIWKKMLFKDQFDMDVEFYVFKDSEQPDCYWAQRKIK